MSGPRARNIIGKSFGKLTVIERSGSDKHRAAIWKCLCVCGNIKLVTTSHLNQGATTSCGCAYYNEDDPRAGNINIVIMNYRKSADKRNLEWSLSKAQALKLFEGACHYCGKEPSNVSNRTKKYPFRFNGIDRKDNYTGYRLENTVSCCELCNRAKHTQGYEQFLIWIMTCFNHLYKDSE